MSEEALKDFLRKQARSLDSLLELTPAKNMFGEDVSDQWKRKKQTPEEKKAARMAKLDPANWKSAKDVYHERSAEAAKKRKREQEAGDEDAEALSQEGLPAKKHKTSTASVSKPAPTEKLAEISDATQIQNKNTKKKLKKRARRQERKEQQEEQNEVRPIEQPNQPATKAKQSNKTDTTQEPKALDNALQRTEKPQSAVKKQQVAGKVVASRQKAKITATSLANATTPKGQEEDKESDESREHDEVEEAGSDIEETKSQDVASEDIETELRHADAEMQDAASTASSSEGIADILSPPQDSAASSVSSIIPPPKQQTTKPDHQPKPDSTKSDGATSIPAIQTEEERQAARQRLQEQISQFRSQRKADDKPVRSRAELLAQRRQKEQERKVAKKEQRRKEKEEEAKQQDEEMAKRFSPGGSGSLLASPRSPMIDDGGSSAFTFGRIAFEDGTQFDAATGSAAQSKKHKGPADPASALKAAQAKQSRIAGLDDQKKQTIEEKDMWLNAKKRAHGERVKDDTSLLKKALKRQDKQKQQSGKDWDTRLEGVRSSQEAKQKKRTDNLQKRKDEKLANKTGGKKKVKRPGFEGSFKGRAGKSKKK